MSIEILRAFAEGCIHHLNNGLCPDVVSGHESRDPDCVVCRALAKPDDKAQDEATKERVCEAIAEALGSAYDCMRVWSAWSCGTMGPGDFWLVAEDGERVAEIAEAAMGAMIAAAPQQAAEQPVAGIPFAGYDPKFCPGSNPDIQQPPAEQGEKTQPVASSALCEVIGCFEAAFAEGLQEALSETKDERLKDLVERRLMHALYAAQNAAPQPPAEPGAELSDEQILDMAEGCTLQFHDLLALVRAAIAADRAARGGAA